ncbi:phosphatase PAP2 family protein [Xenophilus azovorans]|uniref:phosphatase PAP2 family protein n=1 Tax=Xenophilus azovorans TaxID=151755 RepID=UPI00056F7FE3|nr:phosphatase PAP2 family protein [Xenophilus azovorans]
MTDHPPAPLSWTRDLRQRAREHFWLKFIGTVVWVWVFFIGYFHLLRNPVYPVTVMPLTAVDRWMPFQPGWLAAYLSLWVYVGIAPGLQRGFASLLAYGFWSAALCATGLGIFWLWPTQIPPMDVPAGAPGFALLQGIDAAGNACPSMHVAISMFTAVWLESIFRRAGAPAALRVLNLAWFAAIAWSTMAVRQHVLWDVLAGAALGAVFAWASLRWRPAEPQVERLS